MTDNTVVYAVGIGPHFDEGQLKALSHDEQVTQAGGYDRLVGVLGELRERIRKKPPPLPPRPTPVDVVFLIDNIDAHNFKAMTIFLTDYIEKSGVYGDNGLRVAVVAGKIAIHLDSCATKAEVVDAIRLIEFKKDTNLFEDALKYLPVVMEKTRGDAAITRLILITDQLSGYEDFDVKERELKPVIRGYFIGVYAVCIKPDVKPDVDKLIKQMKALSVNEQVTICSKANNSDKLPGALDELRERIRKNPTPLPPKPTPVDAVFLIASSIAITDDHFRDIKKLVTAYVKRSGAYGQYGLKVGVVADKIIIALDQCRTKEEVINVINDLDKPILDQNIDLPRAFKKYLPHMRKMTRSGEARFHLIILVLADQKSGMPPYRSLEVIKEESGNIDIYTVGMGREHVIEELKALSCDDQVTIADDDLVRVVDKLRARIWKIAPLPTPPAGGIQGDQQGKRTNKSSGGGPPKKEKTETT